MAKRTIPEHNATHPAAVQPAALGQGTMPSAVVQPAGPRQRTMQPSEGPPMVLRSPKPTGTQPIDVQPVASLRIATPRLATSHLARIAYASATRLDVPRAQLDALLSAWRRQNAGRGVTGFLLYHRESVFQVLEGFPDVVANLYETIARDPRHHFVAKLIDEPIEDRGFGDWSMGHARLFSAELGALGPLAPFLDPAFRYWHCNAAMARDLIGEFTTGSWRRSIV